jgi:hypothetical protein
MASDEENARQKPMRIYHCEDCGCRIAAQIINGPTEPMPHYYLAAGGGEAFIGCCPICGGTGIEDLSLRREMAIHTADAKPCTHCGKYDPPFGACHCGAR